MYVSIYAVIHITVYSERISTLLYSWSPYVFIQYISWAYDSKHLNTSDVYLNQLS